MIDNLCMPLQSAYPAQSDPSLRSIVCYLDFISPFAWLAFKHLPQALKGLSYSLHYKPVLFGAILRHHGQLGPAEIPAKRDWTYRQVLWLANAAGVALQMPASHPFNPLPLLRLALVCGLKQEPGAVNRQVCEAIFRHVWQGGEDAADPQRLARLSEQLESQRRFEPAEAKLLLAKNTDEAISAGVFGVPTFAVDGKLFWGLDALPMLRDYLSGAPWFDSKDWENVSKVDVGVRRRLS